MIQEKKALKTQVIQQQPVQVEAEVPEQKDDLAEEITQKAIQLKQERKDRRKDTVYNESFKDISSLSLAYQVTLHSKESPGITCIHQLEDTVLTGGMDGHLLLFSTEEQCIIGQLNRHTQPVTRVQILSIEDTQCKVASAGQDGSVKVQAYDFESRESHEIYEDRQDSAVTGLAVHPLGYLLASCLVSGQVMLHDILQKRTVM